MAGHVPKQASGRDSPTQGARPADVGVYVYRSGGETEMLARASEVSRGCPTSFGHQRTVRFVEKLVGSLWPWSPA